MLIHFSCVWLFVTLWTVACQAPLSIGFSRQEYWSGLPCPPPEDLPNPGIEPASLMFPALAGGFSATSTTLLLLSCSVVSDPMWSHGLQHARPPCPSPSPGVCSNSCPLSRWCHPAISSSVVSFSSCLQSFPASWSFPVSQLFASGGQSIGASASILPMNIRGWFPSILMVWSWCPRDSQESSPASQFENINSANICWIIEKAKEFQKNIYLCFIDFAKALDCVDNNKLWKTFKQMGIPDHLTCCLRNLYAHQEATIRTLYRTIDWFKI